LRIHCAGQAVNHIPDYSDLQRKLADMLRAYSEVMFHMGEDLTRYEDGIVRHLCDVSPQEDK